MTKGISVSAREGVETKRGAAAELGVSNLDTTVHNIGIRARTSRGVIDVAGRAGGAVRDRTKTPGGTSLSGKSTIRQLTGLFDPEIGFKVGLNKGNLVLLAWDDVMRNYEITSGLFLISSMVASSNSPA